MVSYFLRSGIRRVHEYSVLKQETSDLEELVIHILVEDIPQEEVARLCQTPDQHEAIKQVYRELPNITKSIGSSNFERTSSDNIAEIVFTAWVPHFRQCPASHFMSKNIFRSERLPGKLRIPVV